MAMVDVGPIAGYTGGLTAKSVGPVWGSAAAWRWPIRQMNRVNSQNNSTTNIVPGIFIIIIIIKLKNDEDYWSTKT